MKRFLLAVCLVLAGCSKRYSPTVFVDPALALLVPSDTTWVAGVRMEPLRNTPMFQRFTNLEGDPMQLKKFIDETGIDPRKDLWEVLVAGNGKEAMLMARGQFTEMGMEPRLKKEGVQRTPYKGYNLMGDDKHAIVFMNSTTAVAGPTPQVKHILDTRGQSGGIPKPLLDKVNQVPRSNQIWFVYTGIDQMPALKRDEAGNFANLNNITGKIKTLSGAFDLTQGMKVHLEGDAINGEDAKRINDTLRGLIGLGRLNTPTDQPQMLKALDALRVSTKENQVFLDASFSMAQIDELQKTFSALGPGLRRPDSSNRLPR